MVVYSETTSCDWLDHDAPECGARAPPPPASQLLTPLTASSTSSMDDNIAVYVGITMGVGIILVCICSRFTHSRRSWSVDPSLLEAFLAEDNTHRFINGGLKRHDIEELLRDVERWECAICNFQNVVPQPTCSLCHTAVGTKLIEPFQEEVAHSLLGANSSYVGSAMLSFQSHHRNPMPLSSSTSFVRGPPISSARRYPKSSIRKQTESRLRHFSSLLNNALLPEDLTPQQRSARMRRQWTRQMDPKNLQVVWMRHFMDSQDFQAAYVIQLNPPQELKMNFEIAVVVSDPRQSIEMQTLPPRSTDTDVSLADRVTWTPVEFIDGNYTVMGTKLLTPVWKNLLDVSRLAFTFKYAWYLQQVASLVVPYNEKHVLFKTPRGKVLEEAVARMNFLADKSLCAIIRVQFAGERGQDAGAVLREWYVVVAQALMHPSSGLFVIANKDDNSYIINSNSGYAIKQSKLHEVNHLEAFKAVGRFIGRALLDGQMLPFHLSPVIFKAILGVPLTLDDIESLDRSVYKSLRYLLDNDNVDGLCLTFSVTEPLGPGLVEVDLVPHGSSIDVTDENKFDYVDLMVRYLLFKRYDAQLLALVEGVYDIVPPELLLPFDHKELELLLCGLSEIEVRDWKANTELSNNLKESTVLQWFWEIVEGMSVAERAKLLQYTTGSARVPVQGFKGLTSHDGRICHFTLKGIPYVVGLYPVVHACFNRIDLPIYPDKSLLEDAMRMLLLSEPTGFDIA
ncbi:Aste57867_19698 [Aphanomyces stellatus]|uniref:HECT-type E3 ubiquitin transferase n=1 Tax=Aphanomyces stellatus TaxID=120398 RepID=A0A485LHR2_9STRA|nr:hypothetical protein As57867_019633 [Aphanomyces stellatus]VFT96398.1 Aste57867_19698 [Aphanomyces stellatus]